MDRRCEPTETTKKPNWISRALSDEQGIPSASRALLALAVVYVLGLVTGALYVQRTLTPEMVDLIENVVLVAGAAYGIPKGLSVMPGGTK